MILLDCLSEKIKDGSKNDYIFSGPRNTLLPSHKVDRGWGEFCLRHKMGSKETDVSKHKYVNCTTTLHMLRHSFATMCYEAGLDKIMVQEMMGHTDYGVTENYTHIRDKMLDSTAKQLEDYVVKSSSK